MSSAKISALAARHAPLGIGADPKLFAITPVPEQIRLFPSTRYYGSKRKLLLWLYDCLKTATFKTVLDAFGGAGSVSQLFRAMRKDVTYHDAFDFNEDVASSLLTNAWSINLDVLTTFLEEVQPLDGTVVRNFAGMFFLDSENAWIDGYAKAVKDSEFKKADKALLRYLLYQACLKKRPFNLFHRANLSLRTQTSVRRSFGNAVTWERPFDEHILKSFDELTEMQAKHALPSAAVLSAGNVTDLPIGYDLVYVDPPYVSGKDRYDRDDYWRRYHFLEGLANYDEWEQRIDPLSPIRAMHTPSHFLDWSNRRKSKEMLYELIDRHRHSSVALSYVKDAYPEDGDILRHFESIFSRVSVHSTEHSHALSSRRRRELLFIGHP